MSQIIERSDQLLKDLVKRRLGEVQDNYARTKDQLERISPEARTKKNVNGITPKEQDIRSGLIVLEWQIASRRLDELLGKS